MNTIRNLLIGNEKGIMEKGIIWNFVSSIEYSLQSAILMLVITRSCGLLDAGIFTIAYSVTQMMSTIGNYGMRSYQVSDAKKEYSFSTYLSSRMISVTAMIIICMSYAFLQNYDNEKMILVSIWCGYRVVEEVEDVFHGEMQKQLRLDVAAKIVAVRIFIVTAIFSLVFIITKDLIISSIALLGTALFISLFLNRIVFDYFQELSLKLTKIDVIKVLWTCLPVCLGGFLYNYLVNAPKYAIDRNLSAEMQTIFSILFMPIFAINMLSSFIFKPMIAKMGIYWHQGKKKLFGRMVGKQIVIILLLTAVLVLAGVLVGVDILGIIYGVNLKEYRLLFAILITFGGVAAMSAYLVVVLTIVRQQRYIIVAYMMAVLFNWCFMDRIVINYQINGAGMVYGASMSIVTVILTIILFNTFQGREKRC